MSILDGSERMRRRSNGHAHEAKSTCPTCGSVIPEALHIAIMGRQRAHDADIEKAVETRFTRQIAEAERRKKSEIAAAVKAASKVAEIKLKTIRDNQETTIATRITAERDKAAKATAELVTATKLEHAAEKLRLETALADLQRKLAAKPAHALGEPAEVDLYEMLVAAFPDDRINRVPKGQPGPDVIVEVMRDGAVVGSIVLDSKNRARWSNKFAAKLRGDQLVAGADFGILSTSIFPSGARELHLQSGVIVASPQRVVVLVDLLKRQIIQNHVFKRGAESRNEKAEQLYDFLLSPAGDEMFDRLLRATKALENLDAAEIKSHQTNWTKRAEIVREIMAVREQFTDVLADIIGGGR